MKGFYTKTHSSCSRTKKLPLQHHTHKHTSTTSLCSVYQGQAHRSSLPGCPGNPVIIQSTERQLAERAVCTVVEIPIGSKAKQPPLWLSTFHRPYLSRMLIGATDMNTHTHAEEWLLNGYQMEQTHYSNYSNTHSLIHSPALRHIPDPPPPAAMFIQHLSSFSYVS